MPRRSRPDTVLNFRMGDPECTRLVAFVRPEGRKIFGAGCLVTKDTVLTCRHVLEATYGKPVTKRTRIRMRLCGFEKAVYVEGTLAAMGSSRGLADDIAVVKLKPSPVSLGISDCEFATPLRYGGKPFSVVGFFDQTPMGYYASGVMRGTNAAGLVQLDGESEILVQPGFSGAPVWSSDVGAFVGIVVAGLQSREVLAWCIPSRVIARVLKSIPVRFRVTPVDRPSVHDYSEDDPNVPLFGNVSDNGSRRLSVTKIKWDKSVEQYRVDVRYQRYRGPPVRGRFVTFILHPSFSDPYEDAYELFSEVHDGVAENHFWADSSFTVAAIGDGGDTALTCNLASFSGKPKEFK